MIVSASELLIGRSYTFSQLEPVVRVTTGTVTGEVKNKRFVRIQCEESGGGKIIDLSVISRIERVDF